MEKQFYLLTDPETYNVHLCQKIKCYKRESIEDNFAHFQIKHDLADILGDFDEVEKAYELLFEEAKKSGEMSEQLVMLNQFCKLR